MRAGSEGAANPPLHNHHRRVVLVLLGSQVAAPVGEERFEYLLRALAAERPQDFPRPVVAVGHSLPVGPLEETIRAEDERAAGRDLNGRLPVLPLRALAQRQAGEGDLRGFSDRKSTRLNSSHANISYAVFCLKKK